MWPHYLYLKLCLGQLHIQDSLDLFWVGLYASLADAEAEELACFHNEYAFLRFQSHTELGEDLEYERQIVDMALGCIAFDMHVINIYLHYLANMLGKHGIDKSLVGRTHILEAEGHDLVAM